MTAILNSTGIAYIDATQTTSNMNTFAAAAVGSVGSYALLRPVSTASGFTGVGGSAAQVGQNFPGSYFVYSNCYGQNQTVYTAPTGTWKLFGTGSVAYNTSGYNATLFMRVA